MPNLYLDKKELEYLILVLDKTDIFHPKPNFGQNLKAYLISIRTAEMERESKSITHIIDIEP